jgi:molybdopterin-binding protein
MVEVASTEIVSVNTRASAESLGLKAGDVVKAILKSTDHD